MGGISGIYNLAIILIYIHFEASVYIIGHEQEHAELFQGDELHVPLVAAAHLQPFQERLRIHVRHADGGAAETSTSSTGPPPRVAGSGRKAAAAAARLQFIQ